MSLPPAFFRQLTELAEATAANYYDQAVSYCDSPIEQSFLTALFVAGLLRNEGFIVAPKGQEPKPDGRKWFIQPQASLLGYRADFLIGSMPKTPGRMLIVECDGHDFHERTKEQAARDRQRDRVFQTEGYKVFRFTGSELYANPFGCALEVMSELLRMGALDD